MSDKINLYGIKYISTTYTYLYLLDIRYLLKADDVNIYFYFYWVSVFTQYYLLLGQDVEDNKPGHS